MDDHSIKLDTPKVERPHKPPKDNVDVQALAVQVMADKLRKYDADGDATLTLLKDRQERVRFAHDFLRDLNKAAQGQGEIKNADTNPELKKYLQKAKDFAEEAQSCETEAEKMKQLAETDAGNAEKHLKDAKNLSQKAVELKDLTKAINNLTDAKGNMKKHLSKEERDRIERTFNSIVDDFNTLNQMDFQQANQLNQDRQSIQLMTRMIVKQADDLMKVINRGIRGQ